MGVTKRNVTSKGNSSSGRSLQILGGVGSRTIVNIKKLTMSRGYSLKDVLGQSQDPSRKIMQMASDRQNGRYKSVASQSRPASRRSHSSSVGIDTVCAKPSEALATPTSEPTSELDEDGPCDLSEVWRSCSQLLDEMREKQQSVVKILTTHQDNSEVQRRLTDFESQMMSVSQYGVQYFRSLEQFQESLSSTSSDTGRYSQRLFRTLRNVRNSLETIQCMSFGRQKTQGSFSFFDQRARLVKLFSNIRKNLEEFQESCKTLFQLSNQPSEKSFGAEDVPMPNFNLIRLASTTFHQHLKELSQQCGLHTHHDIYFDLDADAKPTTNGQFESVRFQLAFGSVDTMTQIPTMMWLEAQWRVFTLRNEFHSVMNAQRGAQKMSKGKSSAKAWSFIKPHIGQGNRITKSVKPSRKPAKPIKLESSFACCDSHFHKTPTDIGCSPMSRNSIHFQKAWASFDEKPLPLSQYIVKNPKMKLKIRLKLARLIAEGLLKFDPRIWQGNEVFGEYTTVVDRDSPVPHFHLRLAPCMDYDHLFSLTDDAKRIMPCGKVTSDLLRTLLLLAGSSLGEIHIVDVENIEQSHGWHKVKRLGTLYKDAVLYCVDNVKETRDIRDPQVQKHFYHGVVRVLKEAECSSVTAGQPCGS